MTTTPKAVPMQLFGSFTSPFVRHLRVVLEETGLDFEFVETDYAQSAAKSPAQRVPFLQDGDVQLTDSTSILKHLRDKAGQPVFADTDNLELYCLANTCLDTAINLFLLEREGLSSNSNSYLQRQAARIQSTLKTLEARHWPSEIQWDDGHIRLACFLDWAIYRNRLDFSGYPNLLKFLAEAAKQPSFIATAPPAA
ncbi:glutathione S-transferase [Idiomarina sp. A28L]|uniref:glutathione S-transferase family protein n=1 Tax=Idiomarina sp. A28L TaxID=1036674 RepID=UPI0002138DAB|nr:glutathione S-transferase family protein [Idiomarina sp. A28L]EGN76097.1 glutathione S-transferase [Idiomarina sp. A28L]